MPAASSTGLASPHAASQAVPAGVLCSVRCLLATLAVALLLSGCGALSDAPPIPEDTFVSVMADMHLVAARHANEGSLPAGLRDSVLAAYGVSSSQFDATLTYYVEHPGAYNDVYSSIVDTLSAVSARLRNDVYERSRSDTLRVRP